MSGDFILSGGAEQGIALFCAFRSLRRSATFLRSAL
jgi:hypothetical protein